MLSYCRFSDSDIYLFHDCGGYIRCCGCSAVGGLFSKKSDPIFFTRTDAIDHVNKHVSDGDNIPSYVVERLNGEIDSLGDFVYNDDPPKKGELCIIEKIEIQGDDSSEDERRIR